MTDVTLTAIAQQTTEQPEAPFEMANLRPEKTGLPFVVGVSQQGGARHGPRIKLSPLPRYNPAEAITVTLEDPPRALAPLPDTDLALVTSWIELNRTTIEQYWSGEIAYTEDMLARIESV
jgi:hypothetical protein